VEAPGAEGGLFAGGDILAIEHPGALEQIEPIFHVLSFLVLNREPFQHCTVSG
jgi:hypothetical protein